MSQRLSPGIYSENVGNLGIILAFGRSNSLALNILLKAFISDRMLGKLTVRFSWIVLLNFIVITAAAVEGDTVQIDRSTPPHET